MLQGAQQINSYKVHQINIIAGLKALFLETLKGDNTNNFNQEEINDVIKKENIKYIFTTKKQVELTYMNAPIIPFDGNEDHEKIINILNNNNQIQKISEGNVLFLFDNYWTMLKYIISYTLQKNNSTDLNIIDYKLRLLITDDDQGLNKFFHDHIRFLPSFSRSTQSQSNIKGSEQTYNLPPPIRIPVFEFNQQCMN